MERSRKQKEELDGYEEEGSTQYHQTTAALRGSPLLCCKGMGTVALKPEHWSSAMVCMWREKFPSAALPAVWSAAHGDMVELQWGCCDLGGDVAAASGLSSAPLMP